MFSLLRHFLRFIRPEYRRDYIDRKVHLHRTSQLVHEVKIKLGEYVYIGPNCFLNGQGGIRISDGSILAPEVVILSSSHDYKKGNLLPYDIYDENREVIIGRGVWIGYRAMICPGVEIGDGAVVAMGAVVTKSVKAGDVVGGNPARTIAQRAYDFRHKVDADRYFIQQYFGRIPTDRISS